MILGMISPLDVAIHMLNVVVLYIVLRLLLYKPIMKYMRKREKTFSDKVDELDAREKELIRRKEQYDHMMADADVQAAAIVSRSNEMARENAKEILEGAKEHAHDLVIRAKKEIEAEKAQTRQELRGEITDMAIEIAEKVLQREVSASDNRKIIDEFFEKVG